MQVICPSNLLERSVASSDKLLWKHAPFYFLAADVATIAYGLSLRLFFLKWGIVEYMLARTLIVSGIIAAIVLLFFLLVTTPTTAGPLGILGVFVCMYVLVLVGLTFLSWGTYKIVVRLLRPFTVRRPLQPLSLLRAYYFSSVLALGPVMLIGMQSVGGINLYELVLVGLFLVIACIYTAKITS